MSGGDLRASSIVRWYHGPRAGGSLVRRGASWSAAALRRFPWRAPEKRQGAGALQNLRHLWAEQSYLSESVPNPIRRLMSCGGQVQNLRFRTLKNLRHLLRHADAHTDERAHAL